ncbi:hypothetical protein D9M72_642590 [compost metagenome]
MARNIETAKLSRKLSTVKTLATHFSEKPCGGKASVSPADSDAATMMKNGPIRKATTRKRTRGEKMRGVIACSSQWRAVSGGDWQQSS